MIVRLLIFRFLRTRSCCHVQKRVMASGVLQNVYKNVTHVLGSQKNAQIKMVSDFKPPQQLSLERSPAENWRRWRQRFELYLLGKEAHEKADKIQIAMLLSAIGPEALERYNHFTWPEPVEGDEKNKVPGKDVYEDVLSRFEQEFAGMKRVVFSRFKFQVQPIRGTRF